MLLWDIEMAAEHDLIGYFSLQGRLEVGVSALSWTLETLSSPIVTSPIRTYLSSGIRLAQQAVSEGATRVNFPAEMLDGFEEVNMLADESGTSHFLAALMTFQEADPGLDVEQLYGVLSYCYEGSLDREDLQVWSPGHERENQRCLQVIDYQKNLINSFLESRWRP